MSEYSLTTQVLEAVLKNAPGLAMLHGMHVHHVEGVARSLLLACRGRLVERFSARCNQCSSFVEVDVLPPIELFRPTADDVEDMRTECDRLRAALERVRELPAKWREGRASFAVTTRDAAAVEALEGCADELERALESKP